MTDRLAFIRALFDDAAAREHALTPLIAPLTADLVRYAAPQPHDRVLDVGTGTGTVARLLSPHVRTVTGLDLSTRSLHVAHTRSPSLRCVCGDIHRPPFAPGSFSLIVASFGLNATDPNRSLRALRRLIAPEGRVVIQEWGPEDALRSALGDVLAHYATHTPDAALRTLRDQLDAYAPVWDAYMQDVDEYVERLTDLGLTVTHAAEESPVDVIAPVDAFLAYWTAQPGRFEELRAMTPAQRAAFNADARAVLDRASLRGRITWQPVLFRVTARARER